MQWTSEELFESLKRYERECEATGLQPITVQSYASYARYFLRWRIGDYRPRSAVGPARAPTRGPASIQDLVADHGAYGAELRAAGLQPKALQTYLAGSDQFVRWLDGRFAPGVRLPGARPRSTNAPSIRPAPVPAAAPVAQGWTWEGSIQVAVVSWLEAAGWTIEKVADTTSGEHGPDIVASTGSRRLAVEVKGYPQPTYARGARAGEPKKWHPAAQARTYFGTAIHVALIMRDSLADTEVAIALPDVPGYRSLLEQVHASLAELRVRVFLVSANGSVRELVPAAV